MIKLLTLLMLLVEGSERDSTGCDGTGIPACLQEYFQHVKDSVREPDLNDVFMVVSPVEKGKRCLSGDVERYDAVYDAIDRAIIETKGYYFMLDHVNIDGSKIVHSNYREVEQVKSALPRFSVRTLPKTFLSKVKVMDLNKRFEEMKGSKEKMLEFKEEFEKTNMGSR
ncbi:MAG: hypothetical protein V8R91_07030 [Butyricimonas faecihominis]